MLGFFDESGDPGLKIGRGSSRYFVTALVTFEDDLAALECDRRISRLRGELNLPDSYEFHFGKNSWRVRVAFLEAVQLYDFRYHIAALDKEALNQGNAPLRSAGELYRYAAGLLLENAKAYLSEVNVIADRTGNRRFRDDLARHLRNSVNQSRGERVIKSVRLQDSHRNNLLQLADYVASVGNQAIHGKAEAVALQEQYLRRKEATRLTWPG